MHEHVQVCAMSLYERSQLVDLLRSGRHRCIARVSIGMNACELCAQVIDVRCQVSTRCPQLFDRHAQIMRLRGEMSNLVMIRLDFLAQILGVSFDGGDVRGDVA